MQPISLSQFTGKVVEIYSGPRYSPATLCRHKMVLAHLARLRTVAEDGSSAPAVITTADLTTATAVRYVRWLGEPEQGVSNPNTVNGYLSALGAACTYAVEEGWLDSPPTWRRVRFTPAEMVKNPLPAYEDLCRLLVHLGTQSCWHGRRLGAAAWLVSLTGLRLREALYAELEDVDLARREFSVVSARQRSRRLKTLSSARTVPLPAALVEVLERWLPVAGPRWLFPGARRMGPWDGGSHVGRPLGALQEVASSIGLPHITWHSLRHAYGTFALERWGVPLWVVQQVMGHRSIRTTEHYLHLRRSPKIAEAVQGITIGLPPRA